MTAPVVEVRDLCKVYEPSPLWLRFLLRTAITSPVTALDHVSLDVGEGEICAVIGPNGAGKSTLFRILTGLTTPTSGSATVHGLDVVRESQMVRRLVGFMPASEQTIYLRHSCTENLVFHGRLQGIDSQRLGRRVRETLELVGLAHAADRVGFALSAGMRARLQLARALLHEPRVLILDEPTGAVDPIGSYQLLEVIQEVAAEEKVPVLLSSHRLEEIEALHDHVALFDSGSLLFQGNIATLRRSWQLPMIELRFGEAAAVATARLALESIGGVEIMDGGDHHLVVSTDMRTGPLLQRLDGALGSLSSVRESMIPLRELLGRMLGPVEGPGST